MNAPDPAAVKCPTCSCIHYQPWNRLCCDGRRRDDVCTDCVTHNAEPKEAIDELIEIVGGWDKVNDDARADMHMWDGEGYVLVDTYLQETRVDAVEPDAEEDALLASIMRRLRKGTTNEQAR